MKSRIAVRKIALGNCHTWGCVVEDRFIPFPSWKVAFRVACMVAAKKRRMFDYGWIDLPLQSNTKAASLDYWAV